MTVTAMAEAAAAPSDQPTYWNEEGGQRWVQNIQRVERMLEPLSDRLLRHAGPRVGERVLDVGCGGGLTSAAFANAVGASGEVLGLDVSAVILAVARERFATVPNLAFELGDAEKIDLKPAVFDLVSSRFGVMFFADPVAAFGNLRRALTVGGRLAFVCWRALEENPWMADCVKAAFSVLPRPEPPAPHAPGPFALADDGRLRQILADSGYAAISIDPFDPTLDLGSLDEAVVQMTRMGPAASAIAAASAADQQAVVAAVRAALEPHAGDGSVRMASGTWLVSARRL
jgi:SAM-dependent methyltransferase